MRLLNIITIFIAILVTVEAQGQWIVQNHTLINTTYVGYPVFARPIAQEPPPGYIRNNTGYHPTGFINPQPGFVRNLTGYNNSNAVKRNGNDLLVGNPGPYDEVLFKEWFTKPARWLQIREKNIEYPLYPKAKKYIITAVHAIDIAKGPGGQANILAGGIGYSYVTIRLFSERSKGFSYKVVIYGH